MNVSKHSLGHILRENLCLSAYRCCVSHLLDARLKKKKVLKGAKKVAKEVPKNAHYRILCTNEKIFNIGKKLYRQNDHESSYEPRGLEESSSPLVIVWWGVTFSGATQIHFCDASVKTNDEVYQAMLNDVLPLLEETVFVDKDGSCFQ